MTSLLALGFDYVVWTEPVKAFAELEGGDLEGEKRNVLVTGISSARAREGLRQTGWTVRERSRS